MPIDAGIYGLQQPVRLNTPFENLNQVLAARNQQETIQNQSLLRQAEAQRQQAETQKLQQQQSDQAAIDQAMASSTDPQAVIEKLRQTSHGHLIPTMQDQFAKAAELNDKAQTAKRAAETAENQYAAHLASSVLSYKDQGPQAMLNAFQVASQVAQAHGHDVSQVVQAVQQDPSSLESRMNAVIAMAQGPQKAENVAAGGQLVTPGAGTAPATVNYSAPAKPEAVTEAQLDAQAQAIFKKQLLKQPLTADEQASLAAYQQRKLMGPEAAAANAANQQARAIAAQTAAQQRTQDFAEQQAGRKELTDKVEQPWITARGSAQTLRDTVSSAQAGNKIGASLQALETTMAAVRAQGLNRVNMAEIGLPASAGSAWDRVQGWFGKATQGQAVPPDIQKDMLTFADVLEKGADEKYKQGWQATTKRYKLNDEKPLVPMGAAPAPRGSSSGVPTSVASLLKGKQDGHYTLSDGSKWVVTNGVPSKEGG